MKNTKAEEFRKDILNFKTKKDLTVIANDIQPGNAKSNWEALFPQLIEEIYEVLYPDEEIKSIPVGNLPKELQNKISRALDDYKIGRYITHEQMKQKVDQAYQLVWSAEAAAAEEEDFKKIILYLKETWSVQSSEKFVAQTYGRLEKLVAMPTMGRSTFQQLVYVYKLDRKNALFFSLEESYLILLSIYPYKKDITKSKYY